MRFAAAIFFALAVIAAQFAHGGIIEPFLPYPAYALVCLGVLCALPSAFGTRRQPWAWLIVAGVALTAYSIWRCSIATDTALATKDATLFLACAGMWAGMSLAVSRNDTRFVFVFICVAAGCVQVIVAAIQLLNTGEFSQPYWLSQQMHDFYVHRFPLRACGLFMNPNHFAWLMNTLALLMLSLGIWGRLGVVKRIIVLYFAALFAVMAVYSGSRGGMLSLVGGFGVFLALSLMAMFVSVKQRRLLFVLVGAVLLAGCAAAAYVAFSTSWVAQGRIDTLTNSDARSGYAEQAFRLFQTSPLMGAGPGSFKYAARLYRTGNVDTDPVFTHNDWLQFPAEYGAVGFSILMIVTVLAAAAGVRGFLMLVRVASTETGSALSNSGAFVLGAICALAASAVHGNVDFNMHVPANALFAAALLGLVTGARPLELERRDSRLRPVAWLAAAAALAAACGLGSILFKRGEGEYRALRAEDALLRSDIKVAAVEADKGLALLPDDPTLLFLRAHAYFEYEAWLEMLSKPQPEELPDEEATDEEAADTGESESDDTAFNEDEGPMLTPEESAKNFRDAVELYERVEKLQPMERKYYTGHGDSLEALGRHDEAKQKYLEAIRLDPAQASPWANYGDYLLDIGQTQAARRIFEIAGKLTGGEYARGQVDSIDEEALIEKEAAQEEQGQQGDESQ